MLTQFWAAFNFFCEMFQKAKAAPESGEESVEANEL